MAASSLTKMVDEEAAFYYRPILSCFIGKKHRSQKG